MNEREIFVAAAQLSDPSEQSAFLHRACGRDDALRQQLVDLLAAHSRAQTFLESPPSGIAAAIAGRITAEACPVTEGPGTKIGPYRLLQEIGEGGFGVVYMAEQQRPVRRLVALKIVKPGMDSRQVVARFEAERQALAMMDHPNIAKVLDAGTTKDEGEGMHEENSDSSFIRQPSAFPSGRPYFVMELVKGIPCTKYCDQHQLTIRQRLELFIPVCQALQHAHQKGIVHRDIKPTNVLVALYDGAPVPKVIDFGIAKATEQRLTEMTLFTGFGQLVGTLQYMSPEQAQFNQLDIDTRSDIYSLGVLLYELLTGTTPLEQARRDTVAFDETLRIIREDEPQKPSIRLSTAITLPTIAANRSVPPAQLRRQISGDLDWIVMKCLEKDRNRRYETASGLATDLQCYLRGEPVQAYPPSTIYRLKKFALRHQGSLAVAAALLVAALAAAGSIGWAVRDQAARAAQIARAEADRLASTERQIRDALARARAMVTEDKLSMARQELAQAQAQALRGGSALANLAAEIKTGEAELERYQQFFDLIDEAYQSETAPREFDTADGAAPSEESSTANNILERRPAAAVPLLLQALERYSVLERDEGPKTLERQLLTPQQLKQIQQASYEVLLWLADDVQRRQQDHRTGQHLARESAAERALVYLSGAETAFKPTQSLYVLRARCHGTIGDGEAAEADTQMAAATPPTIAFDHFLRGQAAFDAKNLPEAVEAFEAALRLDPTHYWSLMKLGNCLGGLGKRPEDWTASAQIITGCILKRPDHAHAYYCRAYVYQKLRRYDQSLADYSKAIQLDPDHVGAWYFRGSIHAVLHQSDQALADYSQVLALDPQHVHAWCGRGSLHEKLDRPAQALADYSRAIEIKPKFAVAWYRRGAFYERSGQAQQALADYSQAIELDPKYALAWCGRARTYASLKQPRKALADYTRAIELDPNQPSPWYGRGLVYDWLGQPERALEDLNRFIELDPRAAHGWSTRAAVQSYLGQPTQALESLDKAIELNPNNKYAWNSRGVAHKRLNQAEDSLSDYTKAIEVDPKYAIAWGNRGNTHLLLGQFDRALADYARAMELAPSSALAHNNLAVFLATCPDAKLRDPARAVDLARRAVELAPQNADYCNTLGIAHYRTDDWVAAIRALTKARELRQKCDASDALFLAMSHAKLGHDDEARAAYQEAVTWLEKNRESVANNKSYADELRRFQQEADAVLAERMSSAN